MKLFIFCAILLNLLSHVHMKGEKEDKTKRLELKKQEGISLALDAVNRIVFGDKSEGAFKDFMVDTSKSILEQIESAPENVPIDTVIRVFFQTIITLMVNKRVDLLAKPIWNTRELENFSSELDHFLNAIGDKGTKNVTLKDLKNLIKILTGDKLWISMARLREKVDEQIERELKKNRRYEKNEF